MFHFYNSTKRLHIFKIGSKLFKITFNLYFSSHIFCILDQISSDSHVSSFKHNLSSLILVYPQGGGSLSRGVSVQGSLSWGISVQGVSVQGGLCPGGLCVGRSLSGRPPVQLRAGGTHPTGMHS